MWYLVKKAPSVTAIPRTLNQSLYSRGKKAKSRGIHRYVTLYYVSSSHISNRSNQKKALPPFPLVSPGMHPKDCDTRSRRDASFFFFLVEPPLLTLKEQPLLWLATGGTEICNVVESGIDVVGSSGTGTRPEHWLNMSKDSGCRLCGKVLEHWTQRCSSSCYDICYSLEQGNLHSNIPNLLPSALPITIFPVFFSSSRFPLCLFLLLYPTCSSLTCKPRSKNKQGKRRKKKKHNWIKKRKETRGPDRPTMVTTEFPTFSDVFPLSVCPSSPSIACAFSTSFASTRVPPSNWNGSMQVREGICWLHLVILPPALLFLILRALREWRKQAIQS